MQTSLLLSHPIHNFSASFWAGTTLFMVRILEPAIRVSGSMGCEIMGRWIKGIRFSLAMAVAGWATVLSGVLMCAWYKDFNLPVTFQMPILLAIGALAAMPGTAAPGCASGKLSRKERLIDGGGAHPTSGALGQIAACSRAASVVAAGSARYSWSF